MQRHYILLKATGAGGWPGWLPYRLDADSAEQAVEKAKEQAEKDRLPDRVAEVEDAMCEQDAANEKRLTDIETALCELDAALNKE
jgi:hypothetical protein